MEKLSYVLHLSLPLMQLVFDVLYSGQGYYLRTPKGIFSRYKFSAGDRHVGLVCLAWIEVCK